MSTRTTGTGPRHDDAVELPDARRYSEEEVGDILRRTTGLERRRRIERPSLTLGEVEAIARESGMDASLVRQAARDLQNERSTKASKGWAGALMKRTLERVVDGELSMEQAERVGADLLDATHGIAPMGGALSAIGRTVTWSGWTPGGIVSAGIASHDGKTSIRVDVDSSQTAAGLFGGLVGGVGGGLGSNVAWILPLVLHLPVVAGALRGRGGARCVLVGAVALREEGELHTPVDGAAHSTRWSRAYGPPSGPERHARCSTLSRPPAAALLARERAAKLAAGGDRARSVSQRSSSRFPCARCRAMMSGSRRGERMRSCLLTLKRPKTTSMSPAETPNSPARKRTM